VTREAFVLAQISDLHCGSAGFDDELLTTVVGEILALAPDLVVVGGDLTADGYAHQFRIAQGHLEPLIEAGLTLVVVPGNHDAKNVGHLHFTDAFGPGDVTGRADRALLLSGGLDHTVQVVAIDSSQPDLPDGAVGRERYDWIRTHFGAVADTRLLVLHHHLLPVPGTGRERNVLADAGDVLGLVTGCGVDLVLSGHKHVPNVWLLNGTLLVNSGTASSHLLRGYVRPSYNVLEITDAEIVVTLRFPGIGERRMATLHRPGRHLVCDTDPTAMFDKAGWHI
jgi:3',5'-cyclic AMP phosphodiesterase CpdA